MKTGIRFCISLLLVLALLLSACGQAGQESAAGPENGTPAPGTMEGETPPGGIQPGGTPPEGMIPGGMHPDGKFPGEMVPGDTQHGGKFPGGMRPGETLPEGAVPGGQAPFGRPDETREVVWPEEALVNDPEENRSENSGSFTVETEVKDGYTAGGGIYTITKAGTYRFSGVSADGQIIVDAGEEKVEILLNGVTLENGADAPIKILSADKVTLTVAEGSYNEIRDTRLLRTEEEAASDNKAAGGAIYAKCDLTLAGSGTLIVDGGYNNGVHTTKDLKIKGLTLKVTAPNNALKGNDTVTVNSGTLLLISTAGDGIKTEDSDVSSKGNQRGTVTIAGGCIEIHAACDGVDASYNVEISGEETVLGIYTGSYSALAGEGAGSVASSGSDDDVSRKGIKADNEILISAGTIRVRSTDDAVHANNDTELENGEAPLGNVTVSGGDLLLASDDDAIHGDGTVSIDGGSIEILTSLEGVEGNQVIFNGGSVRIYATDDGVNAKKVNTEPLIQVNGGYLEVVTASGDTDGIDSNGAYVQTGGFVLVMAGSAQGMMAGSIDTETGVTVTGGTVVALGGICETPKGETNCCVVLLGDESFGAGDYTVTDGEKTLFGFTVSSSCRGGWIASDTLIQGGSYTLLADGSSLYSWTQDARSVGSGGFGPGGPGKGGTGGWPGGAGQGGHGNGR